ncbi:heterokaryon incompatibility, partial [Xylariales sp. AK1849]
MRLLALQADGGLVLTKDLVDDIPQYAIFSHTWGDDDKEVTFYDIQHHTGQHKQGYRKLRFCGKQAALDGLHYFWVDTCCIDKSNSAELSEAIKSMFCWYKNAAQCYFNLPDVSKSICENDKALRALWELSFRKSRWFTRGWTLQEVMRPW